MFFPATDFFSIPDPEDGRIFIKTLLSLMTTFRMSLISDESILLDSGFNLWRAMNSSVADP
jgi:hypothetical protein